MNLLTKLTMISVAVTILSINVRADTSTKNITLHQSVKCTDHNTVLETLKSNGYSPVITNISETGSETDSIIQTWITATGAWVVVEHNTVHRFTCILGSGEKTKLHGTSSKSV